MGAVVNKVRSGISYAPLMDREARILVSGARGKAPTTLYKVSNTYMGPYKLSSSLMIAGNNARAKSIAVGEAIVRSPI